MSWRRLLRRLGIGRRRLVLTIVRDRRGNPVILLTPDALTAADIAAVRSAAARGLAGLDTLSVVRPA